MCELIPVFKGPQPLDDFHKISYKMITTTIIITIIISLAVPVVADLCLISGITDESVEALFAFGFMSAWSQIYESPILLNIQAATVSLQLTRERQGHIERNVTETGSELLLYFLLSYEKVTALKFFKYHNLHMDIYTLRDYYQHY